MERGKKNILTLVILLIFVPFCVILGAIVFKEKYYAFVSVVLAVVSCIPLFYAFEKRHNSASEAAVIAVLVAISVCGRFVFAFVPGFKPICAITVISGMWLGKESGFAIGALSAIVSNFYFGQGPWTPFQMLAWGLIGFVAGLLASPLKKSRIFLCVFGALSGVAFSLMMDVWTAIWTDSGFIFKRYVAFVVASLPVMVEYIVSNIIFLLALSKPIGKRLERIKLKYGLFSV